MLAAFLSLLIFPSLPYPIQAAEGEQTKTLSASSSSAETSFSLKGYLSARYVYRTAEMSTERFGDADMFEELRFDVTMPKEQKYEFHFLGTARQDIDGNQEPGNFSPLEDIGDTGNHRIKGYLYEAHLDVNRPLSSVPQIRIGRQAGTRDEPIFFDGIAVDVEAAKNLNMTVYGGAAVHFYELNNDWGDDTLGGAGIDYTPLKSTALSMDWLSVEDEQQFLSSRTLRDNLLSFKLWQRFSSSVKIMGKYRFISGDPRDVSGRALITFSPADIELNVNYYRQFHPQNELANEFSLYYDVIGQSNPYQTYDIKARKLFGESAALDIGYYKRELLDEQQRSVFNREYKRSYAVLQFLDILTDGLTFSVTGERWDSHERKFGSAGGDVGYSFKRNGKTAIVSAGSYFSLYKYDYYIERGERSKVRTYYVNGRYPLGRGYSVNGGYDYEHGIEDYQTVKLGMRYDF
jgi:hypothetical protein